MKKLLATLLASTTVFALPFTSSMAEERTTSGPVSSAYAQVTSNYVFRGLTQTEDGAAVQGGYDIKQSKNDLGWYAGVFGSNVTDGLEVDLFGGWKGNFGKQSELGYDVGAILYKYTDSANTDITEIYAGINYETAFAKLYMGDGAGVDSYNFLDIGASFIIMQDVDLNLHFGRMLTSPSWSYIGADVKTEVKGFDLGLAVTYEDLTTDKNIEFFVTVGKKFDL